MARGARAPPPPAPDPGPRRLFATARVAAGTRCGRGDPAGGEARAPGAACRERESKSKASRTPPSFPNFAPCGGRRPAARRVPTAPPERGRKKRDGAGAGEEGARARAESPATSVKTWGRRSAGRRRRKRRRGGKEGARGREAQSRRTTFPPVSSAGCAGPGGGRLQARAGFQAGMGPSSRKSIGCQEGSAVGAFFLSLSPPSRG